MQRSFFVEDLPVAASADQYMILKMSEAIQKQWNQSLSIQKQALRGVLTKRFCELGRKFTGEHLCRSAISM